MPVVSRIDWIARQIAMGRRVHIHFGRSDRDDRAKIKVIMDAASSGPISPIVATSVQCALASVRQLAQNFPSTDRGHKHSNGVSEISIWISHTERIRPAQETILPGISADAVTVCADRHQPATHVDADSEKSVSDQPAFWEQELDEHEAVHGQIGGGGSDVENVSDRADWERELDEFEGIHGTIGGGDDDDDTDQHSEYQPAPWEQTAEYLTWEEEVWDQMSHHSGDGVGASGS